MRSQPKTAFLQAEFRHVRNELLLLGMDPSLLEVVVIIHLLRAFSLRDCVLTIHFFPGRVAKLKE